MIWKPCVLPKPMQTSSEHHKGLWKETCLMFPAGLDQKQRDRENKDQGYC